MSLIRLTNMRGDERVQDGMFSYVSLEQRVQADHPLREVRLRSEQEFLEGWGARATAGMRLES